MWKNVSLSNNEWIVILNDSDKEFIRQYVNETVDKEERQKRRKECAKDFNVPLTVIAAITAWSTIRENKSITKVEENVKPKIERLIKNTSDNQKIIIPVNDNVKKDIIREMNFIIFDVDEIQYIDEHLETLAEYYNLSSWTIELIARQNIIWAIKIIDEVRKNAKSQKSLQGDEKEYIRNYVSSGNDEKDKRQRRAEMAKKYSVWIRVIAAITAWDTIKNKKNITIQPWNNAEELWENEIYSIDVPNISWEWMGALIEYNNEIKNARRQKLKDFIDENTNKKNRADMKVLCLPWVECLEIPIYIELWFKPENIVWVEAWIVNWKINDDVLNRFEENANSKWIQYRIWKLERILESENTIFDVISLDFVWPPSKSTEKILSSINISKKALIMTNFQGRRENLFKDKLKTSVWFKKFPKMSDYYELIEKNERSHIDDLVWNTDIIWAKNNESFIEELLKMIFKNNIEKFVFLGLDELLTKEILAIWREKHTDFNNENFDYKNKSDWEMKSILFTDIINSFRNAIKKFWNKNFEEYILLAVNRLMSDIVSWFMLKNIKSLIYRWSNWTPMLSDFIVIEELSQTYYFETRQLRNFIINYFKIYLHKDNLQSLRDISISLYSWNDLVKSSHSILWWISLKRGYTVKIEDKWTEISKLSLWKLINTYEYICKEWLDVDCYKREEVKN